MKLQKQKMKLLCKPYNAPQPFGVRPHTAKHNLYPAIKMRRKTCKRHLFERGADFRYIKDLLGHFNIKTTERYLHVSKQSLVNIISPLDDLFTKGIIYPEED